MISPRVSASAVAVSATVWHAAGSAAQLADPQVVGAEVVAPLADAMRLVDGEERERSIRSGGSQVPAAASRSGAM